MAEDHFGEQVAARYDESSADMFDPAVVEPIVDFLAELAGERRALELGIGTGRIALPLAGAASACTASSCRRRWSRGCARSRAREAIDVTIGDFATTTVDGTFSLAYLVFNTIMNLTTQDAQVACFQQRRRAPRARRLLRDRGRRSGAAAAPARRDVRPFDVSADAPRLRRVRRREPGLISHHYWLVDGQLELVDAVPLRLAVRARPDGAARRDDARERWSGWKREPFTSESTKHVSVWEKPA